MPKSKKEGLSLAQEMAAAAEQAFDPAKRGWSVAERSKGWTPRKDPSPPQGPHPRTVGETTVVIPLGTYLASSAAQPTQPEGDRENLLKGYRISGASDFYGMTSEEVTKVLMAMLEQERKLR